MVVAATTAAAPPGAQIEVHHEGSSIVVVMSARIGGGLGPLAAIAAPTVSATAAAESEAGP